MSTGTGIQWTDATWNPVAGCSLVSPGCTNCYAMKMASRLEAMGQKKYTGLTKKVNGRAVWTGKINLDEAALMQPLSWKKPRRVFVNSMSDLFHPDVPFDFVDRVFAVMALCPQHTFQILTKRPERMAEYLTEHLACLNLSTGRRDPTGGRLHAVCLDLGYDHSPGTWPLPNVWLGTSCEDQARADERIPHLLLCPAAVRFLSLEPLLGPIDLTGIAVPRDSDKLRRDYGSEPSRFNCLTTEYDDVHYHQPPAAINWGIVGGESGPNCRPCNVQWVRSIVQQCQAAGVPLFVKQLGGNILEPRVTGARDGTLPIMEAGWPDGTRILNYCEPEPPHRWRPGEVKLKDKKGGTPEQWPEDLRVRRFPGDLE